MLGWWHTRACPFSFMMEIFVTSRLWTVPMPMVLTGIGGLVSLHKNCNRASNAPRVDACTLTHFLSVLSLAFRSVRSDTTSDLISSSSSSGPTTILLQTMDRLIPDRMNFLPISGALPHARFSDAFVDDTSLGFTPTDDDCTYHELAEKLQNIAHTWEHLLYLSGGKLNLSKCSWFILKWEWEKGDRSSVQFNQPTSPFNSIMGQTQHRPLQFKEELQ